MKTLEILSNKITDKVLFFTPLDIIAGNLWITGDYVTTVNCNCDEFYHDCGPNRRQKFIEVLSQCREDNHYPRLLEEIKNNGFKGSLGAIVTAAHDAIVLVDGHHRLAIACDLNIEHVPVYVARYGTSVADICSMDSQAWSPGEFMSHALDTSYIDIVQSNV